MKTGIIIGLGTLTILAIGAILWYVYMPTNEPILFDDMGRQLSENFLKENRIKATYKMTAGGNNFYKYFNESIEVTKANGFAEDLLPAKLKSFIMANCPNKIFTPNKNGVTGSFDKYIYQLDNKDGYGFRFVEVLVDEPATEVVCYWIRDEKTGAFEKINSISK